MQCPSCKQSIQAEWKSCPFCQLELNATKKCTGCGQELQASWQSCPFCSTPVGSSTAAKPKQNIPLGYCGGSQAAIYPGDPHFKCLSCGQLYTEKFRFLDHPVCETCAYKDGTAQQLEKELSAQREVEARAKEEQLRKEREEARIRIAEKEAKAKREEMSAQREREARAKDEQLRKEREEAKARIAEKEVKAKQEELKIKRIALALEENKQKKLAKEEKIRKKKIAEMEWKQVRKQLLEKTDQLITKRQLDKARLSLSALERHIENQITTKHFTTDISDDEDYQNISSRFITLDKEEKIKIELSSLESMAKFYLDSEQYIAFFDKLIEIRIFEKNSGLNISDSVSYQLFDTFHWKLPKSCPECINYDNMHSFCSCSNGQRGRGLTKYNDFISRNWHT